MIRDDIVSLSTHILKRSWTIATLLAVTLGCSSTNPPHTVLTRREISPVQAQPLEPVLANNSKKPKKFASARSCAENDGFTESVNFATQASNLTQSANSKQEWDEVAALWVQAVAWMQAVPPSSPKRAFAEKKVVEYMRNLAYSQQQAGANRQTSASFSSDLLNQQLELYLSYVATVGPPDVLIVGSSRALQGVDPKALKQSLAQKGRSGLTIFNFAVNGATAQVVDFQLRRLLKPQHLPQMIVWADGVRAFNSGRVDRTFNSIIASEGNQLLVAGIRPKLPEDEPSVIPQCYQFPQPCRRGGFHKASILPVAKMDDRRIGILPVANTAVMAINPVSDLADSIDSNGFMPLSVRYNPNTYYNDRPYVSGRFDRDYENFNLAGKQAQAFNSVIALTKSRKIPLVFVNLPLTDDYLDDTRIWAQEQFRQRMQQLSRQKGFAFRDLSQQWPSRHEYFFDPSHLNRFGAIAVSRLIAADTSITWPNPKSRSIDG
ncbi:hypothetical protein [Microcoleus sp. CAWBG640]|uniref:hypothetical protein n=1 Tax=Microcoleus sp. CAWBG640 TaxID=2841653 RepID=UPI00312B77BA